MENKNKRKIILWGQILFLLEASIYIGIDIMYILNEKNSFYNYITFTEAITLGALGGIMFISIPFLMLKSKLIINLIIPLRILIFIYSIMFFNNITLIFVLESVIFICSIIYICAYLTFKKG